MQAIPPMRRAALIAEGIDNAERDAAKALRLAWPHRHTDRRAAIVTGANVRTLRDVRTIRKEQ